MNFHTQFNAFIRSCREYQKQVDDLDLHFSEPYQSIYLELNKVIIIHTEEKLNLEAMEAGEQTAPGFPNLTPARREYYELEAVVPSFLARSVIAAPCSSDPQIKATSSPCIFFETYKNIGW